MSEWITPVTDRADATARMSYEDINRINGNLQYLNDIGSAHGYIAAATLKCDYTQDDFIYYDEWMITLNVASAIKSAIDSDIELYYPALKKTKESFTWYAINNIESLSMTAYQKWSGLESAKPLYSGEPYSGEAYTGA